MLLGSTSAHLRSKTDGGQADVSIMEPADRQQPLQLQMYVCAPARGRGSTAPMRPKHSAHSCWSFLLSGVAACTGATFQHASLGMLGMYAGNQSHHQP